MWKRSEKCPNRPTKLSKSTRKLRNWCQFCHNRKKVRVKCDCEADRLGSFIIACTVYNVPFVTSSYISSLRLHSTPSVACGNSKAPLVKNGRKIVSMHSKISDLLSNSRRSITRMWTWMYVLLRMKENRDDSITSTFYETWKATCCSLCISFNSVHAAQRQIDFRFSPVSRRRVSGNISFNFFLVDFGLSHNLKLNETSFVTHKSFALLSSLYSPITVTFHFNLYHLKKNFVQTQQMQCQRRQCGA